MDTRSRTKYVVNKLTMQMPKSKRGKLLAHLRRFKLGGCRLCGPCVRRCGQCATCRHCADPPSPSCPDVQSGTDSTIVSLTDTSDSGRPPSSPSDSTLSASSAGNSIGPQQCAGFVHRHDSIHEADDLDDGVDEESQYETLHFSDSEVDLEYISDDSDHEGSQTPNPVYQAALARYSGAWWAPHNESASSSEYEAFSFGDDTMSATKQEPKRKTVSQSEANKDNN
jgi:hypothetical protein